ncbi:paraquat-inducible protein A [Acetobacteraceae bacterium KSS8]|uniref:Paraquat-inducible protein A n=1 Tax=Endosaccharibacter trunci TaxID=2812733 RepID=A0ABT1W930_9PROT|nr:paraquat-inducible protein A [Acetobacteraceae bacterium KSS8]
MPDAGVSARPGRRPITGFRIGAPRKTRSIHLHAIDGLCECPSCGFYQRIPDLEPGQVADCRRCHGQLGRRRPNPTVSTPLAFCVASLVLYLVAISLPMMTLDLYGRIHTVSLVTGPFELWREGWSLVAVLVLAATAIVPPITVVLMLFILIGASRETLPNWAPRLMRRYDQLRPWSMVEVYMLGIFVAYTKLIDLAHVELGPAVYALAALMITQAATDSTFDVDKVWCKRRVSRFVRLPNGRRVVVSTVDSSEHPLPPAGHLVSCTSCGLVCASEIKLPKTGVLGNCPRCHAPVSVRKPQSLSRCVVLLACAVVLYIPANLFPVMTIVKLNRGGGHTILNGVRELYEAGMLPLALLVFFASITVPVLKIVGLALMCLGTWRRSDMRLRDRTRLYRLVVLIGRWSMIDVFMISILVALVRYSGLAHITAEPGMFAFAAVVVLTIFAADCFDPRTMWDAANMNGAAMAPDPHPGKRSTPPQTEPVHA